MSKSTKVFLAGMGALLLLMFLLPSRAKGESPAPMTSLPASQLEPPARTEAPAVASFVPATGKQLADQRARAARSSWDRDPFAVWVAPSREPEAPAQPQPSLLTVALAHQPQSPEPPALTGISLRGDQRWALLDRHIVRTGDKLPSGYQIKAIERHSVTLLWQDTEVVLQLGENQ